MNGEVVDGVTYTAADLKLRDGIQSPEVWIAYKGYVYNVTTSPLFADGKHYRHQCGQDLTVYMEKAPHTDEVMKGFPIVGRYLDK